MVNTRTPARAAAVCWAALLILAAAGCGQKTKGDTGAAGANGTSCSVKDNGNGTSTITCTDGTSATVSNGAKGASGQNGTNCTVHDNGNGTATISCTDGTSATVSNGQNGAGCILTNNGDGTRTITCGNGTAVVVTDNTIDLRVMTPDEIKVANLNTVITGVTVPADGKPVVNLKISERHGWGVRGMAGLASGSTTALAVSWRFALLKLVPGNAFPNQAPNLGVNGSANDTWVSYMGTNATSTTSTETGAAVASSSAGVVTDNGDGTYSYKFAKNVTGGASAAGTTYDASAVHRLVVLIYQSGTPFAPMNLVKDFVPATNADVTGQNEKVDPAACLECHTSFRAVPDGTGVLSAGEFHGGSRYDVRTCVACHNDQRRFQTFTSPPTATGEVDDSGIAWATNCGPAANQCKDTTWVGSLAKVNGEAVINLPVWIHKIHMSEGLSLVGSYAGLGTEINDITFPQDIRNCQKCHRAPAAQADNWKARPSRRACGACHDGVSFLATVPAGRVAHGGGAQADDKSCSTCHNADDTDLNGKPQHLAVLPPDPAATWFVGGTNSNTNAAYIAATGVVPKGATQIKYVVSSVGVDANLHPKIVFKFVNAKDGTDLPFTAPPAAATATQELLPGTSFTGSPSAYFVWALSQDGIQQPSDFNMSASGYIKTINNKVAASTGTISGPVTVGTVTGLYTVTLTGTTLAPPCTSTTPASTACTSMLQGGIGYTYALTSTQPLTQIDLPDYPYGVSPAGYPAQVTGQKVGGLIVPPPDVWATATGCTTTPTDTTALCVARRGVTSSAPSTASVVSNAKCNACHVALGVGPTFHAGQRNDSPTCAFCHKPNQTSSGWSANAKDFIHGIHAASKRTVTFNWHAVSATKNYGEVTYPGILNRCEMCHNAGTYDFSAATTQAALPNMLPSTVATGKYDSSPVTNNGGYYSISPYVTSNNTVNYGYGYSTSNVSYTYPDGWSGTQTVGGNTVNCSQSAPCVCTTTNPCSVSIGTAPVTPQGTALSVTQGSTTCTDAAPCTCTTASSCSAKLATCTATAPCNAQSATLVKSPIVSACSACHDSDPAIDHFKAMGGTFYESRAVYQSRDEECLICHGPNRLASIALVHQDKTP